jgi:hypothetical protein
MMLGMAFRVLSLSLLLVVLPMPSWRTSAQDVAPTLPPGDAWPRCSAQEAGLDPALLDGRRLRE